jgi:hypothetical protein
MRTVRDHLSPRDERKIDSAGTTVADMAEMDGIDRRLRGQALANIEERMVRAAALQADQPHSSTRRQKNLW